MSEAKRLQRIIDQQEDALYRQSRHILELHGGEVRDRGVRPGRKGRPRGSSDVPAAAIIAKHRELLAPTQKHVTQERLAEALGLTVSGLKYLLKLYGLGWPLD